MTVRDTDFLRLLKTALDTGRTTVVFELDRSICFKEGQEGDLGPSEVGL